MPRSQASRRLQFTSVSQAVLNRVSFGIDPFPRTLRACSLKLRDYLGFGVDGVWRSIERSELARLTQIDYEREMAIVVVVPGADGAQETLGVVRVVADPDNIAAEFGIIVRSDLKGSGLGKLLMLKLIRTLREHGTQRLIATVLTQNHRMLEMAQGLGFVLGQPSLEDGTREISIALQSAVTASG